MTMKFQLKKDVPFEYRVQESEAVRRRYPERIPIVVERVLESNIADVDKRKLLVPQDITMMQFQWILRKRLILPAEATICIFVENTNQGILNPLNYFKPSWSIPKMSATMGQIDAEHKDKDGFLYIAYASENVFGH
ncbi:unnamed protein product [Rotaria magnacalcarata]|uniref:Autophagy-related protein n=1 Tax=Rotaria magnacalcarata TaxID=392030 RepID=A0A816M1Z2_9BILA|nr:unnamed protein product [Rotaria magnacalcarata]